MRSPCGSIISLFATSLYLNVPLKPLNELQVVLVLAFSKPLDLNSNHTHLHLLADAHLVEDGLEKLEVLYELVLLSCPSVDPVQLGHSR